MPTDPDALTTCRKHRRGGVAPRRCLGHRSAPAWICGDATDQDVVATLMQGDTAPLLHLAALRQPARLHLHGGICRLGWPDARCVRASADGGRRTGAGQSWADPPRQRGDPVLGRLAVLDASAKLAALLPGNVWDQSGHARRLAGRFAPSFGLFSTSTGSTRKPNKIVPASAGQNRTCAPGSSTAMRGKDGEVGGWTLGSPRLDTRIPDSVIRLMRHKARSGQDIDHPAVFPVALPEFAIGSLHGRRRHRV